MSHRYLTKKQHQEQDQLVVDEMTYFIGLVQEGYRLKYSDLVIMLAAAHAEELYLDSTINLYRLTDRTLRQATKLVLELLEKRLEYDVKEFGYKLSMPLDCPEGDADTFCLDDPNGDLIPDNLLQICHKFFLPDAEQDSNSDDLSEECNKLSLDDADGDLISDDLSEQGDTFCLGGENGYPIPDECWNICDSDGSEHSFQLIEQLYIALRRYLRRLHAKKALYTLTPAQK